MVISLVGIIVLQGLWVSKAISDQEKEFENNVNAALNDVNSSIDEEEALFYLEDELAHLEDSMELEEFESITKKSTVTSNGNRIEISFRNNSSDANFEGFEDEHLPIDEIEASLRQIEVEVQNGVELAESLIVVTQNELNKFDNISTVVRRYVMEHDFSGELSDRISKSSLDALLRKSLKKQGVKLEPQFAVYQAGSDSLLSKFTTSGYNKLQKDEGFNKELFPNDRMVKNNFELFVQFDSMNGMVWSGIKSIVLLCVLFTVLILVCFGYSLHFIFKQKRMSQVKNDFINNMTHELKTPLASISLAASSIQHPSVIENPKEIQRFISIIRSEERRMNEHVERVLDMAALGYQELKMNPEPIELSALIHESIEHIQLAVEDSNGKVDFSSQLESALISVDKFHLLSAFINILDNSVKYSKEELEIQIKLTEESNNFVIEFSDNGIGMKKVAVKHAFDKFYREETGNIHTRKGFGLGLSYVKSIIELHEGSIELTSESGRGTIVRIKLPKS